MPVAEAKAHIRPYISMFAERRMCAFCLSFFWEVGASVELFVLIKYRLNALDL
jgi:hypothetical protein